MALVKAEHDQDQGKADLELASEHHGMALKVRSQGTGQERALAASFSATAIVKDQPPPA